jgi:hypothetical protein
MSVDAGHLGIAAPNSAASEVSRELFRYISLPVLAVALALQIFVAPHPWGWSAEVAAQTALGTEALNRTHLDLEQLPTVIAGMAHGDQKAASALVDIVAPAYRTELLSVNKIGDDQAEVYADLDMKVTSYLLNRTTADASWMTRGGYRAFPSMAPGHPLYVKLPLRIELQRDSFTHLWKLADLRGAMQGEPQFVSFWSTPGWIGDMTIPDLRLTPAANWIAAVVEYPGIFNVLLVFFGLGAALCIVGRRVPVQVAGLSLALAVTACSMTVAPYIAWVFSI